MESVHLFISTGRFTSFEGIREFVEESYDQDGEAIDSEFGTEVGLENYEPGCIECIESETNKPVDAKELMKLAYASNHWLDKVESGFEADAVICVCEPNKLNTPEKTSLTYLGKYTF